MYFHIQQTEMDICYTRFTKIPKIGIGLHKMRSKGFLSVYSTVRSKEKVVRI